MTRVHYLQAASGLALLLAGALAGPATAQTAATVEEVVVTGSFIAGTPEDAALPVDVTTAEDLQKRGTPNTVEFIKSLTITGPVLGDSNQFSTGAQGRVGGGTINLRGLGAQRTLVLLNGHRIGDGVTDTNLIPTEAIGRIEILKDGAAATYGSDAIGGVVNFITKKNFTGLEAAVDYRYVDGSDGDYNASLTWGWAGDHGNVLVSAAYRHRSELKTTDRDFAVQPYLVNPAGYSILGNPGSFLPRRGTTPVSGVLRDANCAAVGGFAGFSGATPACFWSFVPFDNLVEEEDRYQIHAEANARLGETVKLHVEATYAQTSIPRIRFSPGFPPTSGPNGPGSVGVFTVPRTNPGFATALQQAGASATAQSLADNASLTLWRPLANGGNPATDGGGQIGSRRFDIFRVSGGLSGKFENDWGWDITATYSRETSHQVTTDMLIDRVQRALNGFGGPSCTGATPGANGCQFFNPFSNAYAGNPALGLSNPGFVSANQNDPALVRWLFDSQINDAVTNNFVFDAVLNGDLAFSLPGGEIGWAVGAQYRKVLFNSKPGSPFQDPRITPCPVVGDTSCAFRTGPFIFLGQVEPADLEASVWSVFGELSLPITDRINAQLAIRHEDYGGETGSTTNPQIRAKWQVTDHVALRGSVGTTFRGPTAANRAPTGVTGLSGIIAAGNNFKSVDFFGNPDVGPEEALTYNIGVLVDVGPLRATLDYWTVDLDDQIVTIPANVVATAVAGTGNGSQAVNCASPVRSLITFNNNNVCIQGVTVGNDIQRIRSDTTNGPNIKTSGIDATVDVTLPDTWAGGEVAVGGSVSYLIEYKQAEFRFNGALVSQGFDAVGFANYDRLPGTLPEWRANAYAQYTLGDHNIRAQLNYIDGVTDNRAPVSVQDTTGALQPITFGRKVDSFTTLDLTYRVHLPRETILTASILNAFDQDPSEARLELSYDPFIGNPVGRSLRVEMRKRF